MKRNRYVNRFDEHEYPTAPEVVLIGVIVMTLAFAVSLAGVKLKNYAKGELDCSKCHNVLAHETLKNITYFQKQGYKEPTRWLK